MHGATYIFHQEGSKDPISQLDVSVKMLHVSLNLK